MCTLNTWRTLLQTSPTKTLTWSGACIRVFGDPVPVRLAHAIHNILQVVEGGDPAILKNMISVWCAKARRTNSVRSTVLRRRSAATPSQGSPPTTCSCVKTFERICCHFTSKPRAYNINWRDVQTKNVANNVDISCLRAPWQNGPYKN